MMIRVRHPARKIEKGQDGEERTEERKQGRKDGRTEGRKYGGARGKIAPQRKRADAVAPQKKTAALVELKKSRRKPSSTIF